MVVDCFNGERITYSLQQWLCCKIRVLGVLNPFRGFPLRDSVGDGDSERGEAVEYGDTDVKLCDLTVKIPC